jgi:hypothetical protein
MLKNGEKGVSEGGSMDIREHLVKIVKEMLVNNDRNSYDLFEYYSRKA